LGDWYRVTTPDGRVAIVRKSDIGPGKEPQSRGVGADINAALASQLYPKGPSTFQEKGWGIQRIGPTLPEGMRAGIQEGAATTAGGQPPGAADSRGISGGGLRYNYFRGQRPPGPGDLTTIDSPYGRVTVNKQAAEDFRGFLNELGEAGAPIR